MSDLNPYASPSSQPSPVPDVPVLSPPQTAKFELLEEDYLAASLYSAKHVPEIRALYHQQRRKLAVLGGIMLLLAGLAYWTDRSGLALMVVVFGVLGFALIVAALLLVFRQQSAIKRQIRTWIKGGVILLTDDTHTVTLDDNGVHSAVPHVQTIIGWPKVKRVRAAKEHLLLFYQPSSPMIIPARAFNTDQGFQAFCRLAERLWEEHHGRSEPSL